MAELKIGDKVEVMITGGIGVFEAEVVNFYTFGEKQYPRLKVLSEGRYKGVFLQDGDYILATRPHCAAKHKE